MTRGQFVELGVVPRAPVAWGWVRAGHHQVDGDRGQVGALYPVLPVVLYPTCQLEAMKLERVTGTEQAEREQHWFEVTPVN